MPLYQFETHIKSFSFSLSVTGTTRSGPESRSLNRCQYNGWNLKSLRGTICVFDIALLYHSPSFSYFPSHILSLSYSSTHVPSLSPSLNLSISLSLSLSLPLSLSLSISLFLFLSLTLFFSSIFIVVIVQIHRRKVRCIVRT